MATTASSGADASNGDGDLTAKPPADVVIPPKQVRDDIARTAEFVHRRGEGTEHHLRERSGHLQKFAFLNKEDAYNPYYVWYLSELHQGRGPTAGDGNAAQRAQDKKPKGPPEPPKFRFSARMPNISAKDLEILRLTAAYTARNGESWLKELRGRESANFQFDFLRPNHSFFQFFRSLVDQYKILLEDEETVQARLDELTLNIQNRFHVLDRAKARAEYVKYQAQQKQQEEKKVEDERKEYASIDWHDFSIIATVTFDELDDQAELPPPTSLNDLQSASLEQKAMVSLSAGRLEEAAPDDETYYNVSQQVPYAPPPMAPPAQAPMPFSMAPPAQPAYQPQPPAVQDYRTPAHIAREEEEERNIRERQAERERAAQAQAAAKGAGGPMRIRTDYVPRAGVKKQNVPMALCPNCKQQFPANELEDHIRIELLDPRWKEQRSKMESRYSSSNLSTVDVANNLKRFASQRDDVFDGVSGMPISDEEQARRKKAAMSYDGQPDPTKDAVRLQEMQSMNLQDQLKRISEKHGRK
ncbi:Pre-mRNA splicing factor PRP21 like protein-domain-containing protein [Clohesyomyces aquaticus]|uniref:Pre-mRNA splicing factor PRP21 like protein-domain-containing protein n=1 Tax=Clohesyomyces aquaticus TaxID=1231657 RepID=A0A1Y2ABB1_9PLEO|nr:Pre-mRNA splicing factor PRP21 like protein-domain-containing protein [Clohesyomyces aquaticus]